jgi:flavodoxin
MNALVIYDSNFGNTEAIAKVVAQELNAQAVSVKKLSLSILKNIELLVVGSPINAWSATPAIRRFVADLKSLKGVKATTFDTRVKVFFSGNAAKKISSRLAEKGASIISKPMGFYVDDQKGPLLEGESYRAKEWAKLIKLQYGNGK